MAALVRLKRGSVQLRHAALEMKGMGKFFFHADTRTMIPSFDKYETTLANYRPIKRRMYLPSGKTDLKF